MSTQNMSADDLIKTTVDQWIRVGGRFYEDIPSFAKTWNHVLENQGPQHVSPLHPITQLVEYLQALTDTCQQSLYSIERINLYCDKENSNTFAFFVSHYIYDFFARIKSATDLLALLIRHIYEISDAALRDEECSLEKGLVATALRKSTPVDPLKETLAKKLDKARSWIKPLYNLRNVIIHKPGLDFFSLGAVDNSYWRHGIYIRIPFPYVDTIPSITFDGLHPLNALKPLADQGEPFSIFLREIKSKAVHSTDNLSVEPVTLCEEVWALLSSLIEDIIKECHPQIVTFVSKNKLS